MARLAKSSISWSDDDDDEFPDIGALVGRKQLQVQEDASATRSKAKGRKKTEEPAKSAPAVRRRKLGPLTDNLLLRAWTPDSVGDRKEEKRSLNERQATIPRRARVELRTRSTKPAAAIPPSPADEEEEYVSAQEEVTIIEEVSMFDDTFHSCDSEGSEFSGHEDSEEGDGDFFADSPPRKASTKPRIQVKPRKRPGQHSEDATSRDDFDVLEDEEAAELDRLPKKAQDSLSMPATGLKGVGKLGKPGKDLADTMSRLRL